MFTTMIGEQTFTAATTAELARVVRAWIDQEGYGASDIGARWPIRDAGREIVANLSYNGRVTPC